MHTPPRAPIGHAMASNAFDIVTSSSAMNALQTPRRINARGITEAVSLIGDGILKNFGNYRRKAPICFPFFGAGAIYTPQQNRTPVHRVSAIPLR
jgi:hypothetical protein